MSFVNDYRAHPDFAQAWLPGSRPGRLFKSHNGQSSPPFISNADSYVSRYFTISPWDSVAAVMTTKFQLFPLWQYSCFKNALLFNHCSTFLNKTHTIKEHIQFGFCTLIIMINNKLILMLYTKKVLWRKGLLKLQI